MPSTEKFHDVLNLDKNVTKRDMTDNVHNKQHKQHRDNASCIHACMHDEDTEPGVFFRPTPEDLQQLCELYEGCCRVPLNNASAAVLEKWFDKMEPALIREAVQRTGLYAKRPGAPYIRAILTNWARQGIHTIEQLEAVEQIDLQKKQQELRHTAALRPWWQKENPALQYQQRTYTEADFPDSFYFDPITQSYGDGKAD